MESMEDRTMRLSDLPPLYVAFRGVKMFSRFGGEAVPTRGQPCLSLLRRSAAVPLFLCCGESEAFGACMFKVSRKSESVDADRDGC